MYIYIYICVCVCRSMAERTVDHTALLPRYNLCCSCSRNVAASADDQLLPVPFCARHYVCRSCFLCRGGLTYCPGCVVAPVTRADASWTQQRGVNGAHANGNGPPTTTTTTTHDVCTACGRGTDQSIYCHQCTDVDTSHRVLCHQCWQQHQLDLHVVPRLQLGVTGTTSSAVTTTSSAELQAPQGDDRDRPPASNMRQIRPRLMMSEQSLSSLLGGLVLQSGSTSSGSRSGGAGGSGGLVAVGLHDPSARRRRLAALQAPLSRQYEGWLWQALNNGGFEQAVHNIDERKQQIGANLQTTLRDMEFRLERARGVLDELYREYMRQVIEVSRCQVEALQVQSESLQRVRAAAARLQHARVYNDKPRALIAETDLANTLRHNAASTCLRPCDDGWIEFRSASDDELRSYLHSTCSVDSRVHSGHCTVQSVDREVNCLSWTVVGRLSEVDIQLRNHCHADVDDAGLTMLISDSRGVELTYEYQRRSHGHYVVRYRPQLTGTHHIYVLLHDRHLADSPYTVSQRLVSRTCASMFIIIIIIIIIIIPVVGK